MCFKCIGVFQQKTLLVLDFARRKYLLGNVNTNKEDT